jgi:hypothetical protein
LRTLLDAFSKHLAREVARVALRRIVRKLHLYGLGLGKGNRYNRKNEDKQRSSHPSPPGCHTNWSLKPISKSGFGLCIHLANIWFPLFRQYNHLDLYVHNLEGRL